MPAARFYLFRFLRPVPIPVLIIVVLDEVSPWSGILCVYKLLAAVCVWAR
jgi:hypothetical protein